MMPFNPFSALTSKIFGGLSIVLILAIAVLLLAKNHTIDQLRDQIDNPKTGYKVQLALVNQSLGTCHANNATLTTAMTTQNASLDRLAAAGKANADASAAQLALIRRADAADTATLQRTIASVPKTANACVNADAIIDAVTKKGAAK